MKRILSFGGGVQTTALALLVAQGKLVIDEAIFADTGGEKPETYWFIDNYIRPLFNELNIPLQFVRSEVPNEQPDLYAFLYRNHDIPSIRQRRCTDHFKIRPIKRAYPKNIHMMIGFSIDEAYRSRRKRTAWASESYPLIELNLTSADCQRIIQDYGWPVPLKSSCFFCPFQPPFEWQWLKQNHPELFARALELESRWHQRKPQYRDTFGIYRGLPLRHIAEGQQYSMGLTLEKSCWSGHCGH